MTMTLLAGISQSYVCLGAAIALLILILFDASKRSSNKLRQIPTVGPTLPLFTYIGAVRLLSNSSKVIQDGYDKYKDGLFKVADFRSWIIFVSEPKYIEDIRKAPLDILTFDAAIDQALHALAPTIRKSLLHVPIVQNQLTRELTDSFHEINEEVLTALSERLSAVGSEWTSVSILGLTLDVVCRTTHRLFVGLPLCRRREYIEFAKEFAMGTSKAVSFVRFFPEALQRAVGRPFVDVPRSIDRMMEFLRPIVAERKRNLVQFGKSYAGQPEDLITWFLEVVDGDTDEDKLRHIAFHTLALNFGAVYTTTTSLIQAIHHLTAHPELIEPLRTEVEDTISHEGWTKAALGEMRKLDSFLKESQRLTGLAAVSTYRRVLKPFVFSDGTEIPPGTTIAITANCTHLDDSVYPSAHTFDGLRFCKSEDESSLFVTPSSTYLPFGVGRHTCPGRFFTVTLMKTIMAHLLLNYNLRQDTNETSESANSWFALERIPSEDEDVLLQRRSCED